MGRGPGICYRFNDRDVWGSDDPSRRIHLTQTVKCGQYGKGITGTTVGLCSIRMRETPGVREVERVECSSRRRIVVDGRQS